MSEIFPILHFNLNILATFLSNIAKYFIATLQLKLAEIFLETNEYLIVIERFRWNVSILHISIIFRNVASDDEKIFFSFFSF